MIPMRDGVKLNTTIILPRGVRSAPIMLTRTPYSAARRTSQSASSRMDMILPMADDTMTAAGYIRVYQDVRGKYGSEGRYLGQRPLRGPLNQTATDDSTDAWDTVDWLVHHVPESNGNVGMIGNSSDGMLVLMALIHPHPALKVAIASCPVVDTWLGDDDYHNGAFRLIGLDFYLYQHSSRTSGGDLWRDAYDDYDTFLRAGSTHDFIASRGLEQLPMVRRLEQHPDYDGYWRALALQTSLAKQVQQVPTLFIAGQWDQEDIYGAIAAYQATRSKDEKHIDHLVIGPWSHGGWQRDDSGLGVFRFDGDTARYFRTRILQPFLDEHLVPGAPKSSLPAVLAYQTGTNVWRPLPSWPPRCDAGCSAAMHNLYLKPHFGLTFEAPSSADEPSDEYVSDPAKPVPYRARPIRPTNAEGSTWHQWLVDDQRNYSDRTDVLSYQSEPLGTPVTIAGTPIVNLIASTSGTDADWVVKLIDVYPDEVPSQPELGGYQLGIAMDIFRGRYRESFEQPAPIAPNVPLTYKFALPNASHVFLPGHRIMVQIQSSWFPLYDRNPQSFVPNIFYARASDYHAATVRVFHASGRASFIELPITP